MANSSKLSNPYILHLDSSLSVVLRRLVSTSENCLIKPLSTILGEKTGLQDQFLDGRVLMKVVTICCCNWKKKRLDRFQGKELFKQLTFKREINNKTLGRLIKLKKRVFVFDIAHILHYRQLECLPNRAEGF